MNERKYVVAMVDCLVLVICAVKYSKMCNKNDKNVIVSI